MKKIIRKILKPFIPLSVRDYVRYNVFDGYASKSYSQEGEDLILKRLFESKPNGFYVDVGAHHPKRFSNTYIFYLRGWHGINIDAMPGSMKAFDKYRPRDINLEVAVSDRAQTLTYHIFDEPALNGFSASLSESRDDTKYHLLRKVPVKTFPLSEILEQHVPSGQQIDFMSIDVEGLDLDVLKSNNWSVFVPRFIVIEILDASLRGLMESPVVQYLDDKGYSMYSKLAQSVVFKLR
jgi:FkbM family methyltransferase